jgi:hypothetical protein
MTDICSCRIRRIFFGWRLRLDLHGNHHDADRGFEMETLRHSALRLLTPLMVIALVKIALGAAQSPTLVSARPCRVVNATQGKHFPPDRGEALAAAIESANPDDQLEITGTCTGTYTLRQNIDLTGVSTNQFPIPTLDGGQAGSTLTVASGVTATLTDLTITGGTGASDGSNIHPSFGGGIFNGGNLTLIACAVSGNRAVRNGDGGGIWNAGSLILRGASLVSGNVADNEGGGISNAGGSVSVMESSTVSGNIAGDFGGGIRNSGALTIDASTVTANLGSFSGGGGIYNLGTLTVQNSSTLSDNSGRFDGGGILNRGTVTVNSSTLSGNRGSGSGGAINNRGGIVILNSSRVSGNENGVGGGIFNDTGTLTLNSSVVTENTAFVSGGGIYNNAGAVNLNSSVVTANIPDNCIGVPGC